MSSPSGSSQTGKRKRSNTNSTMNANSEMDTMLQPSSRDASGEEGDTTAPESSVKLPQSKRQRAGLERIANTSTVPSTALHSTVTDPGEPSDTTEASLDIANRVARKTRRNNYHSNPPISQDGVEMNMGNVQESNSDHSAMPPPSTNNMVHPAGYRTNPPPAGRPVRVYADGVFDLFHLGHMRQLEQAKNAFPDVHLIVGVTGDEETHRRKGLTVLSGADRADTVRHCKWVDEVIENCPWIVTPEFLDTHMIDYVAHDDIPYGADEGDDIYKPIKEQGKFLVTQRTEGVSTTGIITKIVRDYEKYITRQMGRGMSRHELNVSWIKKNEMDIKRQVLELRDNVRNNWSTTGQELSREIRQLWPTSRPQSPARVPAIQTAQNGDPGLNAPKSPSQVTTPGTERDLMTGYTLGLIGGVRNWMDNRRRTINRDSRAPSDDDDYESDAKSDARKSMDIRKSSDSAGKVQVVTPTPLK